MISLCNVKCLEGDFMIEILTVSPLFEVKKSINEKSVQLARRPHKILNREIHFKGPIKFI